MGLQATNAGIDFQQRVSAFMMILMEFEIEVSKVLRIDNANEKIYKIDFEACESIDDLILTLESGRRIFFQMKRTISLSDDSSSEFYKVCKQFVEQNIKNRTSDIAYVLMTRSESSSIVVHKLRRVLDGIKKINDIVNKYRNPSAHPEFMSIDKANECREIMPDRLDYLMECVFN